MNNRLLQFLNPCPQRLCNLFVIHIADTIRLTGQIKAKQQRPTTDTPPRARKSLTTLRVHESQPLTFHRAANFPVRSMKCRTSAPPNILTALPSMFRLGLQPLAHTNNPALSAIGATQFSPARKRWVTVCAKCTSACAASSAQAFRLALPLRRMSTEP